VTGQFALADNDFNGDGIPDIAMAVNGTNQIDVLIGKGDGTFPTNKAADFNGDCKTDLVGMKFGLESEQAFYIYAGDGTWGFLPNQPRIFTIPASDHVHNIVVGDFNGDGHADIAFVGHVWSDIRGCDGSFSGLDIS
jgi:hypothetical protein